MKKIKLKKDWIIPAGTEFTDCCDLTVDYGEGMHESILEVSKYSCMSLFIDEQSTIDKPDFFEIFFEIDESPKH